MDDSSDEFHSVIIFIVILFFKSVCTSLHDHLLSEIYQNKTLHISQSVP